MFSDHNAVRLDLNYRRKTIKSSNIWRLNNTLLNNQQITEDAWNDFYFFEFTKARFMAQDVIYPGEGSVCA